MPSLLATLFHHNQWANLRLLDFCAGLDEAHLDASAPGTYGRLRDTLVHLVSAEERYVGRLSGQPHPNPLGYPDNFPGFPALRERAERTGAAMVEMADRLRSGEMLEGTRAGQPYTVPTEVAVIQALNHATEHRAHVCTILGQQGVEPPAVDGWSYGVEVLGLPE